MKNIINDEIDTPTDCLKGLQPTAQLRFKDIGPTSMVLEQYWEAAGHVTTEGRWIAVQFESQKINKKCRQCCYWMGTCSCSLHIKNPKTCKKYKRETI
jgi:hypothetical protein